MINLMWERPNRASIENFVCWCFIDPVKFLGKKNDNDDVNSADTLGLESGPDLVMARILFDCALKYKSNYP